MHWCSLLLVICPLNCFSNCSNPTATAAALGGLGPSGTTVGNNPQAGLYGIFSGGLSYEACEWHAVHICRGCDNNVKDSETCFPASRRALPFGPAVCNSSPPLKCQGKEERPGVSCCWKRNGKGDPVFTFFSKLLAVASQLATPKGHTATLSRSEVYCSALRCGPLYLHL